MLCYKRGAFLRGICPFLNEFNLLRIKLCTIYKSVPSNIDKEITVVPHWKETRDAKEIRLTKKMYQILYEKPRLVSDKDIIMKDLLVLHKLCSIHNVYFPKRFCDKLSKCYIISCLAPSVNDRLLYHSGRQVGGVEGVSVI